MKDKRAVDINDAQIFCNVTKYLWIGFESSLNQKKANLKNYSVSTEQESEFVINLIYIELKQSEEGFKPNDKLDRYDTFRKLPDLVVDFTISPRLQMEAYENFEVYNC